MRDLPEGWVETTLGDMGVLARGKSKHRPRWAPHLFGGDYPFIQTGEVKAAGKYITTFENTYSKDGLAQSKLWGKDTLCITIAANIAEISILRFSACFPDSVLGFIPDKEKCDLDFVYYYFSIVQARLRQLAIGSVQDNINLGTFEKLPFLFPPLPEQKAIAAMLSSFDEKIELLREQNKTLETLAKTIFKEWFVHFNFPDPHGNPYRNNGGAMVASELGLIPQDWRVGRLSEVAEFLNGLALQKYPPINGKETLPAIKIRELKQGITSVTDRVNTELDKKYMIDNGDILFSWSGSLEVVIWKYGKGALNQHLFKVSSKDYPKWFYYYWTLYHLRWFRSIAADKATTMGHIQRKHLDEAKVLIPSDDIMEQGTALFEPIIEKMIVTNEQIQTLSKTRDALLPKLMNGSVQLNGVAL